MTLGSGGNYGTDYNLSGGYNMVVSKGSSAGSTTRRVGYNAGYFNGGRTAI